MFSLQDGMVPVAVLCACFPEKPIVFEAIGANAATGNQSPPLVQGTYDITVTYSFNVVAAGAVESFARIINGAVVKYHIFKTIQGAAVGSTPLQVVRVRVLLDENDAVQINANGTGVGNQCNMNVIVQAV
jgi:hypothetical protein